LLQLTFGNVLLVHGFTCSLGTAQLCRHFLEATSRHFPCHHPVGCGGRLLRQLAQESHFSLLDNGVAISCWCCSVLTLKCWSYSHRTTLCLARCCDRNRFLVHSRVALRAQVKLRASMKVWEKTAPAAAILAALSTLACCVPLGFPWRRRTRKH
jgi:hypothetical protein